MIGSRISHFEIVSLLGRGGMGEVYLAEDTTLDRQVAIKVLPRDLADDPDRLTRLRREARALAAINHPNIAAVYSFETVDGPQPGEGELSFLVMELVHGVTLSTEIRQGGCTLERFFQIALPLCSALRAAHDQGVVHRDLKPANIMIGKDGRLKVLDFGLAKRLIDAAPPDIELDAPTASLPTASGRIVGTPNYMAPEQIRGAAADLRSDVFALGLVLHELLTGERVFRGTSSPDLVTAILRDSPPAVDEMREDLPHHLARVIQRCLEKDPDRRFQSVRDVQIELENLAREIQVDEIRSSPAQSPPSAEPIRERPAIRGYRVALLVVATLIALGLVWAVVDRSTTEPPTSPASQIRSMAVLPFDNLMNDPEQDYFVDGMQEALITDLSKLGDLRVISRTSAMRYRDSDQSLPAIASELKVDALVEGSVLRSGNRVRITAQLIDGRTDEHLWADSFDRDLGDVLPLLSDVARTIAEQIELTLTPEEQSRLAARKQIDPAAHEAYLKGNHFFLRFTAEGYRRAIDFYKQAIETQPDYAEAYAGLGGCHLLLGGFGIGDRDEQVALTRRYTMEAIRLDPELSTAHGLYGWIKLYFEWDWDAAAASFERALALDPYDPYASHGYGDYLTVMGDPLQGYEYVKRATEVDPLSPLVNGPVVGHAIMARKYDEAIAKAEELLEIDPGFPGVAFFLANAHWYRGELKQALAVHRRRWKNRPETLEAVDRGCRADGPHGALLEVARLYEPQARNGQIGPRNIAFYYALAGDADSAIRWLEVAYDQRVPQLMLMKQEPVWDLIRSDPRFADIARRVGIP